MTDENDTPQITPERIQFLEAAEALANDPEVRGDFFSLMKKQNPKLSIPEVDVRSQMQSALEQEREERAKLEQRVRDNETRDKIRADRAQALKESGLGEGDIDEIEKVMTEQGIANHVTAAKFVAQSRQLAGGSTTEAKKNPPPPNPYAEAKENFGGNIRDWAKSTGLAAWRGFGKQKAA